MSTIELIVIAFVVVVLFAIAANSIFTIRQQTVGVVERLGVCRSCRVSDKKNRFFSKSRALNFKNIALKSA